jgi:hypothetical protein
MFWELYLCLSSNKKVPTQMGPLEIAFLDHWTLVWGGVEWSGVVALQLSVSPGLCGHDVKPHVAS